MKESRSRGFTLVELLATIVITVIVAVVAEQGLVRLIALDELDKEKAGMLCRLSELAARSQPLVSVGAKAEQTSEACLNIRYPYMVFGIACETNRFTQVTNTVVQVRQTMAANGRMVPDNTLETVVMSGRKGVGLVHTNSMPELDPLLVESKAALARKSAGSTNIYGIVELSFAYRMNGVDDKPVEVGLAIPIRVRNTAYEGYPEYDD